MKCLIYVGNDDTKLGTVIRTNEQVAPRKVATGEWDYCPKLEWKAFKRSNHGRDVESSG